MTVLIAAMLVQGAAFYDDQFQRERAASSIYVACLFRENDRRRAAGITDLAGFGRSCRAERDEIVRLDRESGRSEDVIAAGLRGIDDTTRENFVNMDRFYPAGRTQG